MLCCATTTPRMRSQFGGIHNHARDGPEEFVRAFCTGTDHCHTAACAQASCEKKTPARSMTLSGRKNIFMLGNAGEFRDNYYRLTAWLPSAQPANKSLGGRHSHRAVRQRSTDRVRHLSICGTQYVHQQKKKCCRDCAGLNQMLEN